MIDDPYKNLFRPSALDEITRRQRMLDDLLKPSAAQRILERIEQARTATKMFEHLDRHSKLMSFLQTPAYMKALEAATSVRTLSDIGARLESTQLAVHRVADIGRLAELAAARVRPFESLLRVDNWTSALTQRMAAIDVDWAVADAEEESAEAFARLSRLSDLTREAPVYADETTEILVDELGEPTLAPAEVETSEVREARYDAAGRERELIAFPPAHYKEILVSAGHLVSFPPPPLVAVEGGLIEPVAFSPETGFLLQSLEANLRELVVAQLKALEGDAWLKRRVPEGVRKAWIAGQQAAREAGKPVFAPIHYANFMDLADVITAGNNWGTFQGFFANKDNLRVGLIRLYGIRNDIAHARPISLTDQLIAVIEGAILFRAMGLAVTFGR
ncbi:hypothetical protein [Caulobacter rhizosphaerae]|uniref:hypothetical protein n=1 Tax=Caulobacter rhizosphaerae TaxID=2010972 RepID=UPI0013D26986|nr:hypothetical protein [Caulobacter rhizosphaerae]GGL35618.1 hypothetical protein GCM10010983_35770 [Caulobacter rhizosphaerae]